MMLYQGAILYHPLVWMSYMSMQGLFFYIQESNLKPLTWRNYRVT